MSLVHRLQESNYGSINRPNLHQKPMAVPKLLGSPAPRVMVSDELLARALGSCGSSRRTEDPDDESRDLPEKGLEVLGRSCCLFTPNFWKVCDGKLKL